MQIGMDYQVIEKGGSRLIGSCQKSELVHTHRTALGVGSSHVTEIAYLLSRLSEVIARARGDAVGECEKVEVTERVHDQQSGLDQCSAVSSYSVRRKWGRKTMF